MDKTKGKRDGATAPGTQDKAKETAHPDRAGAIWVREDGAVCIGNECITLKNADDGALDLTLDPDKCGCEERGTLLDTLAACIVSGKGINLAIKPRQQQ